MLCVELDVSWDALLLNGFLGFHVITAPFTHSHYHTTTSQIILTNLLHSLSTGFARTKPNQNITVPSGFCSITSKHIDQPVCSLDEIIDGNCNSITECLRSLRN